AEPVPVEHVRRRQPLGDGRHPSGVAEGMPDGGGVFAVRVELRPVPPDRRVKVDLSGRDVPEDGEGRERLARRERGHERVGGPRPRTSDVGPPTPHVDDEPPLNVDGEGGARLFSAGEELLERVTDGPKRRINKSIHAYLLPHGEDGDP